MLGISCDSVYALKVWAEQLGVGYPMCSDFWPHGAMSRMYGVFNEELGRPDRTIIVIDSEGVCRYIDMHEFREVPDEEEIAEELAKADQRPGTR